MCLGKSESEGVAGKEGWAMGRKVGLWVGSESYVAQKATAKSCHYILTAISWKNFEERGALVQLILAKFILSPVWEIDFGNKNGCRDLPR